MDIDRVLIDRQQIARRVSELGARIAADLRAEHAELSEPGRVVLVPILTGSLVFLADLIRHMPVKLSIRPVTISSYPGKATSSQGAEITGTLPTDLRGADVLIVDDILDSGKTLGLIKRVLMAQGPRSIRLAVLLTKRKPCGRADPIVAEYSGFEIEDEFVVGYGLDYDGYFRNLPDIAVLKREPTD